MTRRLGFVLFIVGAIVGVWRARQSDAPADDTWTHHKDRMA